MRKFNLMTLGFGMIAGILVERYATSENVSKIKKAIKDKCDEVANKMDVDYVDDEVEIDEALMTASLDIPDDTPDDSDYLFIEPIKIFNLSTAHSILGEILCEFEHNRGVRIYDILAWINQYEYDYDGCDLYTDRYRLKYKNKLKEYGWVDPSDFDISWDEEHKCYHLTTAAPVRLNHDTENNDETKEKTDDTNNDTETKAEDTADTGSTEDSTEL